MKKVALTVVLPALIGILLSSLSRSQRAQTQNQASVINTGTAVAGASGRYSLALNGVDACVEVPSSESLNILGPITVEAWINASRTGLQGIVERHNSSDGGYALRLTSGGGLQFLLFRNSSDFDSVAGQTTVSTGTWHHVVGEFDGAQLRVYLDGALDGVTSPAHGPEGSTANLRIGVLGESNSGFFTGSIDEVRLTAGVRYQANFAPARHLTAGGLILLGEQSAPRGVWTFDDQTANDFSGRNNNGSIVGGGTFAAESAFQSQGTGSSQVVINFDELPAGFDVSNYYSQIKFAQDPPPCQ